MTVLVGVYLRGEALDPDHVSRILGCSPSTSQKKGGLQAGSRKYPAGIGLWAITADDESHNIPQQIDEVLQFLGNPPRPLSEIEGVQEAYLDIFVAFEDEANFSVMFEVTGDQIAVLNRLGLSVRFTAN